MARKAGRLPEVWATLQKKAYSVDQFVSEPYKLLTAHGIPYGTAVQILNKLEQTDYIEKRFNGGVRLIEIRLLKKELGEDILGTPKAVHIPVVAVSAPGFVKKAERMSKRPLIDEEFQTDKEIVAGNGVIVLVDYYNIYMRNVETHTDFPLDELLEAGRHYGELVRSYAFIPSHVSESIQIRLRRAGHRIISCPSVKNGGGDSVDKTIDEFAQDFVGHPNIATLVIVSEDRDLQDTYSFIRNKGKKAVRICVDINQRALCSDDGYAIPLRRIDDNDSGNETEIPSIDVNIYDQILSDLEQGGKKIVPESDGKWKVLKAIIKELKERGWASDRYRKGFVALYKLAWENMRREPIISRNATQKDFSEAFSALHAHGILIKREQAQDPKTYYTFNAKSPLLKHLS